jgi:hypothetical protein
VHDAPDIRSVPIDVEMRMDVGGRLQIALDHLTPGADNNHGLWRKILIGNSAGLDDHQPRSRIPTADVAAGPCHKAVAVQLSTPPTDLFSQHLKHVSPPDPGALPATADE